MRDLISAMRSRAISASRLLSRSLLDEADGLVDGQVREIGDVQVAEAHVQRDLVEPLAVAGLAGVRLAFGRVAPRALFAALFLVEAFELEAGAEAALAPAVLGVEREQARIELGEAGAAGRAGALDAEHLHLGLLRRGVEVEHVHQALAHVERADDVALEQVGAVASAR